MYVRLFQRIDENGDGYLSASELRALVIGIRFEDIDFDKDDAVEKLMNEFDTSKDLRVDVGEFVAGVSKWLNEAKRLEDIASAVDRPVSRSLKLFSDFRMVSFPYFVFTVLIKCLYFGLLFKTLYTNDESE